MNRTIVTTGKELYLTEDMPFYINRISESFELEQHKHEFVEMAFVSEGKGYHYIEGERLAVKKGDFFFLPRGVSHVFRPSSTKRAGGHLIVYNCLFDESYALRLLHAFDWEEDGKRLLTAVYPDAEWIRTTDNGGALAHTFVSMHEQFMTREAGFKVLIQSHIANLLIYLQRSRLSGMSDKDTTAGRTPARQQGDPIVRVAGRIRDNPTLCGTAAEIAREIGWSERHFRRKFKEGCGMSFMSYVHHCRVELICRLLENGGENISVIAELAGYKDIPFFNRLFKEKTGMTPRQYRDAAVRGNTNVAR